MSAGPADEPDRAAPLASVRVLEVTQSIAGQTAGMLLADLGAEVVRVAHPDAPPMGSRELAGWLVRNRGKRLVRPDSPGVLLAGMQELVGGADMLLTDLSPEELARARLGRGDVASMAPACIHAWLPPTSAEGPLRNLPHDTLLLEALGGSASYYPAHEDRPVAAVAPLAAVLHGALGAAHAVIELVGRERTGEVGPVVVGGLRAQALANHLLMIEGVGGPMVYSGNKSIEGNAHYRFYETSDGQWLFLAALGDVLFIEALTVLDRLDVMARPDMRGEFSNVLRPEVTAEVGRELQATFRTRTADDWMTRFRAADVPLARVLDRAAWLGSDVVAHACPPVRVDHPEVGSLLMPGVPVELSITPPAPGRVPNTGEWEPIADLVGEWGPAPRLHDRPVRERSAPPLEGISVVEMALFVAAPVIGSLLAGAGAEVVKVEPPRGDQYRSYAAAFATLNHGKQELRLDVGQPEGRSRLLEMASEADVLIDNLRPESLERLGLSPSVLETVAPRLVRASVTAFGQSGPWVASPGFDPILQAMSGLAAAQGGESRPVASTNPLHDVTTGALGALGVASSMFERERSGRGQRVYVSLAATSTLLQGGELAEYPGCPPPVVGGPDHPGPSPWHRFYRAADGWIALGHTPPTGRPALMRALGESEASIDRDDVMFRLAERFSATRVEEWLDLLSASGVPAAPVLERGAFDAAFLAGTGFTTVIDAGELGQLAVLTPFVH